ncbi:MAG: hypothetical protein ACKV22_09885 [Bryobacteraceae bacterium]
MEGEAHETADAEIPIDYGDPVDAVEASLVLATFDDGEGGVVLEFAEVEAGEEARFVSRPSAGGELKFPCELKLAPPTRGRT